MEKLKFTFQVKPTTDGKSNYIAITAIVTEDEKYFLIPEEFQAISQHTYIQTSKTFVTVKNTLKKRHQTRSVWIKTTEDILKTYVDEDGNMIFQNQFLEETTKEQLTVVSKTCSEDPIAKILEKLIENQEKKEKQSIKKLADKFVIEKFDGKSSNANQWMEVFEKECERFNVLKDEERIEIFRLFLEKSCTDWYSSMIIKLTLHSEWLQWKSSFIQTYANKGWTTSKYALSFKYQYGSLLEYAVKKEKLLLEVRKTIDEGTLIDIIAAGLPDFITDRINKEEILHTKDLFSELGKLEHLVAKKKNIKKKTIPSK
ncbi:uncharacterized protein LOC130899977 [Diorhabda carinulata]|uniref:uncharacterized protein LOC130899977 n=1 Tax=Diorhabda carinulata TaxID=1163345 RepID=UPI0025A200BC|nr:uncharacterized protein LOC130899977 [Diorhabda carinulata]